MIKIYSSENKQEKVLKKVCKKLKIQNEGVSFAAYEKFFGGFLFAFAIKEKKVYIFGEDENKQESRYSIYDIGDISKISIDNRTDFNVHLVNGKYINLTSAVGVKASNKKIVKLFNDSLNQNR